MRLENEFLCVDIEEAGAEATRIFDKQKDTEVLWEGDPLYWKRHSPVLFPNVGKTYQNTVRIDGLQYPTSQHGFARDNTFTCIKSTEDTASFLLHSSEETKEVYPFDFELYITYRLERKTLHVQWKVKNPSDEPMYFTIGGHPAFRFAGKYEKKEDYCLRFPRKEVLEYILVHPESGAGNPDEVFKMELENETYPLTEELFANDALIFDNGQIEEVWICHKDGTPYAGLCCKGFPNFGIWSVKDAPFVCLEPWAGRCDDHGFAGDISEKPGINRLEGQETFRKEYQIVVA
ncbi:aldose 1-epimerase family protein [Muricomes sp. OA1]|uniref:Aldose 1-epimerase family protein n=2 Tax=Lachnospiraceae TaxID=186803 RepID=A0A3E2X2D1_9FIRM|nr:MULTISPECIES: aldose 1-epimerase family protein [Clostridia]MEE0200080.1 aldose 1-epimerase family protein [Muricomes sp.]MCH1971235.1 aldose 1-epimerase family protein [Muricomes sp. OA1]MRM89968.1 aldose 1-epimerase family protein [Faecalicatena contorta]RGC34966.1 aldose 1-epimerase family protein [Hungatella hathewayi]GKH34533.1 aldose 1-epimerase [Faecalicatena contorta]